MKDRLPSAETQYLDLLEDIRDNGEYRNDRTGTGTKSLFGERMKYDLRDGAPVLTSKFVALGAVAHELVWFTRGDTNIQYLVQNNVNIWNEWPFVAYLKKENIAIPPQGSSEWKDLLARYVKNVAEDDNFAAEHGDLGPVYSKQWRRVLNSRGEYVDQLINAQNAIRHNPDSRRIIVNSWNVAELDEMSDAGLPPCHMQYQFYASHERDEASGKLYLDMQMHQRSADMFLGVPFNMAQYAMLLTMMAQTTDRTPRFFVHNFGDAHIYSNHENQVNEQLSRRDDLYPAPRIELNPDITDITEFSRKDIQVADYKYHPAIKAPVAI